MSQSTEDDNATKATTYVVRSGDHLSAIAKRFCFSDFEQIWKTDANSALREKRKDPHQLVAGDKLAIPERRFTRNARPTANTHVFNVKIEKLELRLKLLDMADKPLTNTPCTLVADGLTSELHTDGDGFVKIKIRRDTRQAKLLVQGQTYALGVGHMGPTEEDLGSHMRLRNLGYLTMAPDGSVVTSEVVQAVKEFQAANGMDVTGELDSTTRDKLVEVHGC